MKRLINSLRTIALLLVVAIAGCSPAADPNAPPEIVYGEDVCERCGMIISDERFAAGVVVEHAPQQYEHLVFDDAGEMFAYIRNEADNLDIVSYYVHDYHSKEWLDARTSHFVMTEKLHTPMGSGIAAFENRSAAEAMAEGNGGSVLRFEEVQEQAMKPEFIEHAESEEHKGHASMP